MFISVEVHGVSSKVTKRPARNTSKAYWTGTYKFVIVEDGCVKRTCFATMVVDDYQKVPQVLHPLFDETMLQRTAQKVLDELYPVMTNNIAVLDRNRAVFDTTHEMTNSGVPTWSFKEDYDSENPYRIVDMAEETRLYWSRVSRKPTKIDPMEGVQKELDLEGANLVPSLGDLVIGSMDHSK